jgi:hypothetical protein
VLHQTQGHVNFANVVRVPVADRLRRFEVCVFIRQDGRLEGLRTYLRKLWNAVGGNPDPASSETLARDFSDELT